jgi:putative transposase
MTDYRRSLVPGGTFFFTVNLPDRERAILIERIEALRRAFRYTRDRHPFTIDAIAVLPDHLHTIWTLPEGDADFSTRWRLVKSAFSRQLPRETPQRESLGAKAERGVWQRRYWEHAIRDEQDRARHLDYIHFNPVKHGHVSRASDWPYSSFRLMVQRGIYPVDWGGDMGEAPSGYGERR